MEEGFAGFSGAFDGLDGFVDQDGGGFAFEDLGWAAVAGEGRVEFEEVVVREPFVEAHGARVGGRIGFDSSDVPFTEVSAVVTGLVEQVCDGDFFGAKGPTGSKGAHAVGMTSGQEAGAGG